MTKRRRGEPDRLLPGMQLAIFEIVWPTFPWIKAIWLKKGDQQLHFFVEVASTPEGEEWEDCRRLIGEVVEVGTSLDEAALGGGHTIRYGSLVPADEGYLELMSDHVFRAIAKNHAPWRLDSGR